MSESHPTSKPAHLDKYGNVVGSNVEKAPESRKTDDEPMTGSQMSYLKTLSDESGEPFDEHLTTAEASRRIDDLQIQTGRLRD